MDYDKTRFAGYVLKVIYELNNRNIKFQNKYWDEIVDFCNGIWNEPYREHNDRYLTQCLYNLQEKADRGIITKEDWKRIEERFGEYLQ